MELRHATTRGNLNSILMQGLLPSKSVGKRQAVWLHSPSKTPWALLHTQTRKGASLEDVVVLTIQVPRSWLTRHQTGLWFCGQTIPASRITQVTEATDYAVSPVQDN
mgnify:CR=1 FL=1